MNTHKNDCSLQNVNDFYKSLDVPKTIKKESNDFSFSDEIKSETKSIRDLLSDNMPQKQFQMLNLITKTQNHINNLLNSIETQNFNRYSDILPYKHSIVKLQGNNEQNQYINANFINCPFRDRAFIVTQGPLSNTFMKFWRMAWEQNADLIIMLTKEREKDHIKCDQYWPGLEQILSEGHLSVKLVNTVRSEQFNIVERTFQIKNNQDQRYITQVHWEGWSDLRVPAEKDYKIIEYLVLKAVFQFEQSKVPIIHCSGGVGRSGTFVGLSNIYMILKYHAVNQTPLNKIELNIFDIIRRLREQRIKMVQTDTQLGLIYDLTKVFIRKLLQI